jgi:glycosyltransferase involved in cell wall biosynthesis
MEVTILMPCLNEAETLADCIAAAQRGLSNAGVEGEILIADNGSTDGSQDLARKLGARVVDVPEKGYGNALRHGMEAAHGRFLIMGDSDRSYDFAEIKPFVEKLRSGADLVMGCRMPAGGGKIIPGAMPWKHRWIGNFSQNGPPHHRHGIRQRDGYQSFATRLAHRRSAHHAP